MISVTNANAHTRMIALFTISKEFPYEQFVLFIQTDLKIMFASIHFITLFCITKLSRKWKQLQMSKNRCAYHTTMECVVQNEISLFLVQLKWSFQVEFTYANTESAIIQESKNYYEVIARLSCYFARSQYMQEKNVSVMSKTFLENKLDG